MEQIKKLHNINSLDSFSGKLKGKKVFLRADFNVPIKDGIVTDAYRIESTMKTFSFLKKEGAITIVASHIETKDVESPTLEPVFTYILEHFPEFAVIFCKNFLDKQEVDTLLDSCAEGDFVLFENIRNAKEDGMSEKGNDDAFAKYLKSFTEFYINDAFAVSHRAHTSVAKLAELYDAEHKAAGMQMNVEIEYLGNAVTPELPFVAILSGAKFSTKLPLIEKYLHTADLVLVGGALYNNVLKSLGYEVGKSLVDTDAEYVDTLVKSDSFTQKVYVPEFVVVKDSESDEIREAHISDVKATETIRDISKLSINAFMQKVTDMKTKTILWNGPIGNFEVEPFREGTHELGKLLVEYVKNNSGQSQLILGGGDTVSAIRDVEGVENNSSVFVSTGGGAMLEFLEKEGEIPGVVSLK